MRKVPLLLLVFLISGLVLISGCTGGSSGPSATNSSESTTPLTTTTKSPPPASSTALLNETFTYPWDTLWMSYVSPYGGNSTFVGFKIEYSGAEVLVTTPSAFQQGLLPYMWYNWSTLNLLQPQGGTWSDMQGHTITWSTSPDGTAEYGGHDFMLIEYSWSYTGTSENVSLSGDEKSGKTTVIYAYLKLGNIRLVEERP